MLHALKTLNHAVSLFSLEPNDLTVAYLEVCTKLYRFACEGNNIEYVDTLKPWDEAATALGIEIEVYVGGGS
jgi:hypothetical protein